MRDRVAEGLQLLVYGSELGCALLNALFELFVELLDLFQGSFQLRGALRDPIFEGLVESADLPINLFALRDVAEVPHPTVVRTVRALNRRAVAIEGSPILQQDLIAAFLVWMLVEISYSCQKRLRLDKFVQYCLQRGIV